VYPAQEAYLIVKNKVDAIKYDHDAKNVKTHFNFVFLMFLRNIDAFQRQILEKLIIRAENLSRATIFFGVDNHL
jgi:hypothetical protein